MYSLPNTVLPIFGGYIVDKIGTRPSNLVFAFLITLGQLFFALGASLRLYPLSLFGRAVFGLGGECLNVSQFNTVLHWFPSNQLSTALSIIASIDRLSTAINDNIEPLLVQSTSLAFGLWFGVIICTLSLISAVLVNYIDKQKQGKPEKLLDSQPEKINCADLKGFSLSFYLLCANCALVNADVYCFNNIASKYFQDRFGYNEVEAGRIISITFIIPAILCPFIGVWLDRVGKRIWFVFGAAAGVAAAHILFIVTPKSNRPVGPILYMGVIGIGFAVYTAVIWSSVPYVVKEKVSGTAFGVMVASYNLALVVVPVIIGTILEANSTENGYFRVSAFLIGIGALGVLNTIILYFVNKNEDGRLCSPNRLNKVLNT